MRAKTLFPVLGGMLLIVSALTAIYAIRHRHGAEASLSALVAKRASLDAELERMKSRIFAAEKTHAELARTLNELSPPTGAAAAQKTNTKPELLRSMSDIISKDPQAEVLMLRWQRAVVLLSYGPFFRTKGVSSDQIKKFQDNSVKREERRIDLQAAGRTQDELGKQTVAKLQEQAKAEYEAAQLEVLGAEGYQQLQEFNRTVVVRNVLVLGLAGAAALEGVPLTAEQGEQLWQAALSAGSRDKNISGEKLVTTINWDALDAQARQILSPAQFALFTTTAHPSGFSPRGQFQLDAVVRRALEADAAASAKP